MATTTSRYKAYLYVLLSQYIYDTVGIDITERVIWGGIPAIKRSGGDAADYGFGTFVYSDIDLKCANVDGYFNDENDSRSIFKYNRDKAKVNIVLNDDIVGDKIIFSGIINEEATKTSGEKEEIQFKVLSRDSILRTLKVQSGIITNGMLCSDAIKSLLNQTEVLSVLNYSASNINVGADFVIDDGNYFSEMATRKALDDLLITSNSIMLIDSNYNMIVKSRQENSTTSVLNLYGPFDIMGRQNIIGLSDYNSGKHRIFTSVIISGVEYENVAYSSTFGYKSKEFTFDFITTAATKLAVATGLCEEFKSSKIELKVEAPSTVVKGWDLYDRVSLNYPLRIVPAPGTFLPFVDVAKIDSTEMKLPISQGCIEVIKNIAFKIIEIVENVGYFTTTLKLRQIGKSLSDGTFSSTPLAMIDYAVIDLSTVSGTGSPSYNPSAIGAALIDTTLVA